MKNILLPFILNFFFLILNAQGKDIETATNSPIVTTENGIIRGKNEDNDIAIFLGIPYAAPPVGKLRWMPPANVKNWPDTLNCVEFGSSCPQPPREPGPFSEDCLYLNVFTTKNNLRNEISKKPVMLWIHGGGFYHGSPKGYDGSILAQKGVIVVSINYRLGPFGYLAHPALEKNSPHNSSGNYGLLDQIAALKWVKNNIAFFGGDPGNVTIWGESAGAFSVGALLASPLAKGLFHKAILQSGTGLINGIQSLEKAHEYAIKGAESIGIKGSDGNALKALYSLTTEDLLKVYKRPYMLPLQAFYTWFSPVVDGWVIPLPLDQAIKADKWNNVPILLGTNMNEGAYFQREKPADDIGKFYRLLGPESLGDRSGILKKIYVVTDTSAIFEKSQEVVGDFGFIGPARALARMATSKNDKVFLYDFTRISIDSAGKVLKTLHTNELSFVFGHTLKDWVPYARLNGTSREDSMIAKTMSDYWVNFAIYGDPNGRGISLAAVKWPLFDLKNNSYLEIGKKMIPKRNLRKSCLDAIDEFSRQKGEWRF